MKICRFGEGRLGVVDGTDVIDVSAALDLIPAATYPYPAGDALIGNLETMMPRIVELAAVGERLAVSDVAFLAPVANPSKIIGAPSNYERHIAEAGRDKAISAGRKRSTIAEAGLFLKANTSLVGVSEGVTLRFPERRTDHELELAAIIGQTCTNVAEADALDVVAGYAIGLDMVVRGPEERSLRKSIDSYSVLGPWMVTADEIADPDNLDMWLKVNGEDRQSTNTSDMIFNVARQIAVMSSFYTLYAGDILMTGTPEGVGQVVAGDVMEMWCEGIGESRVPVFGEAGA
jgi:2-keto-4-pentenoate hydratase/2-oxohepta-3-ene-1,7-dioic acid hydratase in catechol pathway